MNKIIVNLKHLVENYKKMKRFVGKKAKCGAVVKGNAYGVGEKEVAYSLLKAKVKNFFCFSLTEGIIVRKIARKYFPKSKDVKIFIMNGILKNESKFFEKYDLIPVLNNEEQINSWLMSAKRRNERLKAILQFDTGMNRSGFSYLDAGRIAEKIARNPLRKHIEIIYIMSHLACTDEPKHPRNKLQKARLEQVRKFFPGIPACFSASGGAILGDEYHYDLLRIGKALYGQVDYKRNKAGFKQVLYFESRIKKVHGDSAFVSVGYNHGYFSNSVHSTDLKKSTFVYCKGKKFHVTKVSANEMEIQTNGKVKVGDKIEIASKNVLLDKIGENVNNIFYIYQISLCSLNRDITAYKGLNKNIKVKLDDEEIKILRKNQKDLKFNKNGTIKYFVSFVTEKKKMKEDDFVGYGANYKAKKGETLLTIPVGYSDGFVRNLSNKGFYVECKNVECEVVGNISMNQVVLRAPRKFANKINIGDKVLIFSEKRKNKLKGKLDILSEEVVLAVGSRG